MGRKRHRNLNPNDNPYIIRRESSTEEPKTTTLEPKKVNKYIRFLNKAGRTFAIIIGTLIGIGFIILGILIIWICILGWNTIWADPDALGSILAVIGFFLSILIIFGFIFGIIVIIIAIYTLIITFTTSHYTPVKRRKKKGGGSF